jgi:hypothetical protein
MRSVLLRRLTLFVAALTLTANAAFAEPVYTPATETVYLGIGCETSGTTCTTTEYWLGTSPGKSGVGNTNTITPVAWALGKAGSPTAFATFPGGDTLAPSYTMRTDAPITGKVVLNGYYTGAELAADTTVRAVLEATRSDNLEMIQLGDVTVNKPAITPSAATAGSNVFNFSMPAKAELEKVAIQDLTLTLWVDGVAVLTSGFVDGKGASSLQLPYYEVEEL